MSCEKIIYSLVVLQYLFFIFCLALQMEEENFTLKQQIEEQFAEIQKLKRQVVKLKPTDEDDDDDETGSPPPTKKKKVRYCEIKSR